MTDIIGNTTEQEEITGVLTFVLENVLSEEDMIKFLLSLQDKYNTLLYGKDWKGKYPWQRGVWHTVADALIFLGYEPWLTEKVSLMDFRKELMRVFEYLLNWVLEKKMEPERVFEIYKLSLNSRGKSDMVANMEKIVKLSLSSNGDEERLIEILKLFFKTWNLAGWTLRDLFEFYCRKRLIITHYLAQKKN